MSVKEVMRKVKELQYDPLNLSDEEYSLFRRATDLKNYEGKLVKHFKGKCYLILGIAEHTETGEDLVMYKAMYGDYKKYVRPIDMFLSKVDKVKYPDAKQKYRMEFIELTEEQEEKGGN